MSAAKELLIGILLGIGLSFSDVAIAMVCGSQFPAPEIAAVQSTQSELNIEGIGSGKATHPLQLTAQL